MQMKYFICFFIYKSCIIDLHTEIMGLVEELDPYNKGLLYGCIATSIVFTCVNIFISIIF